MAFSRKALRQALFDRLSSSVPSVPPENWHRNPLDWDTAGPKPAACFFADVTQTPEDRGIQSPPVWHLPCQLVIFVERRGSVDEDPADQLDDILDEVEAALRHDATTEVRRGWWTTLGDACVRAYISGPVESYIGEQTGQAGLQVPIEITVGQG